MVDLVSFPDPPLMGRALGGEEGLGDNPMRVCPEGMLWLCNNWPLARAPIRGGSGNEIMVDHWIFTRLMGGAARLQ